MIGVIAKMPVKPGKEEEFEEVANALIANVMANEPDCQLYELFKSADGGVYVFMEKYSNKDALMSHGKMDYFLAAQPRIGACLAGPPDIQVLTAV